MSTPGEIVIQAALHQSGRWVTIPLTVEDTYWLWAVLDTGSPVSAVSPRTAAALIAGGFLLDLPRPNRYLLASLSVEAQPLPDLEVGVIRRLDRLDVTALLGLNFLMSIRPHPLRHRSPTTAFGALLDRPAQ